MRGKPVVQGVPGAQSLYPSAAHTIPLFSLLYYTWAGVDIWLPLRILMWVLLLFGSLPMIAYLETMKLGMKKYEPGLMKLVTLPKGRFLGEPKVLSRLT